MRAKEAPYQNRITITSVEPSEDVCAYRKSYRKRHTNLQARCSIPRFARGKLTSNEKSAVRLAIRNRSCPCRAARIGTRIQDRNRCEDCYV
jgi:hypothetical protein